MTDDTGRRLFEEMLAKDPYDEATRRVFADWLEERCLDDEAARQRAWTREWQEAHDWMTAFAAQTDIPYEDLIRAGHEFIQDGEYYVQSGDDSARDAMFDAETRNEYWSHWEVLTKCEAGTRSSPFSCSC